MTGEKRLFFHFTLLYQSVITFQTAVIVIKICLCYAEVPAILAHHEEFLEELRKRLEHWDVKQCVGDVFLDTVSLVL